MIQSCSLWPPFNRLSEIEYCTSVPIPNVLCVCVCASTVCVDREQQRSFIISIILRLHMNLIIVIKVHMPGFDNQELIDNPGSLR